MKKLISIIASLLICVAIFSAFPVVYADEVDTTIPPEETTYKETVPPEEEVVPVIWDPQPDEVND